MKFDALIIGTGQAGPALAARLAGAGMKVAVVERSKFGGTCVNNGCTPTKALAHHGPALVEVHVARQELAMPPSITLEQAAGFGLLMLRAVLSGRGDEIIGLAKVNVLRQGRSWITRDQVRRAKPDPDLALR